MLNELLATLGNKRALRREIAKSVKAAFDGVDWTKQTFTVAGIGVLRSGEETQFYKAGEIDAAIKRLNAVLEDFGG